MRLIVGLFPGGSKLLVGLDIGSSSIKVCEMSGRAGAGFRLLKLAAVPLPPDSIVDGDIMDSNAVVSAIRQALAGQGIKARDAAISLSGQQVIVKKVTLQSMGKSELLESVRWEAESFFPPGQGLDGYVLDYTVLEDRKPEGGMDVLLAACRKDKLESYVSCASRAGLRPALVDLDIFALQNAFEAVRPKVDYEEVVALVNIGANCTNLAMMVGSRSVFWRDLAFGGNRYTSKIMDDWGVSREGAEDLKKGAAAEDRQPAEIGPSLSAVSDSFAGELARNTEFFQANFKIDHIDRVVLSGGGSKIPGLAGALRDRFRITVETFDPLDRIEMGAGIDRGAASDVGCAAAVVVGLALREEGGR
jgi:type IV pilus assembly protein PilM